MNKNGNRAYIFIISVMISIYEVGSNMVFVNWYIKNFTEVTNMLNWQ